MLCRLYYIILDMKSPFLLLKRKVRSMPRLNRLLGVRVRLHYTWLPALILIIAAVITQFSTAYPLWERIILGAIASGLFLVAIFVREFTITFIATHRGVRVRRVILFAIGGVHIIDKETTHISHELLLAVAGILSNLIIAGILYGVYYALEYTGNVIIDVLIQWLAFIYFMLAIFHFVPAFPLDGGRVLRALLWKTTHDYRRATLISSWTGWGVGVIMTIGGIIVVVLTQQWFVGILLAFPGLVLQNAATHSRKQAGQQSPVASGDKIAIQPDQFTTGSPEESHQ
jgi:Zn-dependent protease